MLKNLLLEYQKDWIENPDFGNSGKVHNWRNYVPYEFVEIWKDLSVETRTAIIFMAEIKSDQEEWD